MAAYEILLLGDGSNLFRTIAWVLEYKGYAVRVAANPEAALEALVKKNYDLVIAKLTPAEQDGVDVLKRAKRLNPEVKIMVLSGNHEVTLPPEAYQIEVDDYILFPVRPTELCRRVNHCLESLEIVDLVPARTNPVQTAIEVSERTLDRLMVMFHDLRSLLVSNSASMKLLLRGKFGKMDVNAQAKLQEVSDNLNSLILLTEEFMTKSFSGVGDEEMTREMLDLRHDVITPVLEELTAELHNHRITLDNRLRRLSPTVIPVKGSKVWLKSVFRNLVNNGIRHGGDGCTIVIDWHRQGNNSRLNVYNTGKPVPEEYRSLLFSKFTRKPRRAKGGGMGLGLYLSRNIINKHGGDIRYEPTEDGSNFVVTLPQA
jgi:signal transduction histidine kinase